MTILISKLLGPASFLSGANVEQNNTSILKRLNKALYFVSGRLARRRSRKVLAGLDDRMLKDIGVARWQAEEELKRDFWK